MPILPFNESERPPSLTGVITGSIQDTTPVDGLRQGVELRTTVDLFLSTQPKFWSGDSTRFGVLGHKAVQGPESIGVPGSWTHYEGDVRWTDTQDRWEAVKYIRNTASFIGPRYVDRGPQDKYEGVMEPFDILKGPHDTQPHLVTNVPHGDMTVISQEVPFRGSATGFPFQDFSSALTGSLRPNGGWWNPTEAKDVPWVDHEADALVNSLTNEDARMKAALIGSLNLDDDTEIRRTADVRSATSGRDVYGPGQGVVGTDSLAFVGTFRGS